MIVRKPPYGIMDVSTYYIIIIIIIHLYFSHSHK